MLDLGNMPISSAERSKYAFDGFEPADKMLRFHLEFLDDYSVGIAKNDVVLLGAETGAGKTALAKRIAQRNVLAGKCVFYYALEAEPNEIEVRIGYELVMSYAQADHNMPRGASFGRWRACMYDTYPKFPEYKDRAQTELRERYQNLHTFYKKGDFGLPEMTREFLAAHATADLIVLDHLHYVDLADGPENVEYKRTIKLVRDLALEMDTPVLLVAHLRKKQRGGLKQIVPDIEDFHGSSDLIKVATKCILIAPAYVDTLPPGIAGTYAWVAKDRRVGTTNYVGLLAYNLATCDYQAGYQLGKKNQVGTEWTETRLFDLPAWAEHAHRPQMQSDTWAR